MWNSVEYANVVFSVCIVCFKYPDIVIGGCGDGELFLKFPGLDYLSIEW